MPNEPKTAIVTGASQGIGAAVVKTFLARGYCVVANSRNITKSGAFEQSDRLALVDGNIGESATAAKVVQLAIAKFINRCAHQQCRYILRQAFYGIYGRGF